MSDSIGLVFCSTVGDGGVAGITREDCACEGPLWSVWLAELARRWSSALRARALIDGLSTYDQSYYMTLTAVVQPPLVPHRVFGCTLIRCHGEMMRESNGVE